MFLFSLVRFFLYPNNYAEEDSWYEQKYWQIKNKSTCETGIDKIEDKST